MKKGMLVLLIVLILLVLGMGGYLVYDKILSKEDKKQEEQTEQKKDEKSEDSNLDKISIKSFMNKINYYKVDGEKVKLSCNDQEAYISINLPTLYIDGVEYKNLKTKIENDFKNLIELANKDDFSDVSAKNYSITNINYSNFYKDELLIININQKVTNCGSNYGPGITTYVIDIENKKLLTLNEILSKYNIDKADVKNRFLNESDENSMLNVNDGVRELFLKYSDDLSEDYFSLIIDTDGVIQIWFNNVVSINYHV